MSGRGKAVLKTGPCTGEVPDEAVEPNQDGQQREPGEEAAYLGAQPSLLEDNQRPVGGIQPSLTSVAPNLSYGVLPVAAGTPHRTFTALQDGSGMNSGTYDVRPSS